MAAAALGTVALWSSTRGEQQHGPVYFGPLNRGAASVGSASAEPNADSFVGLVNQGATCYLSSVLQALYMTPEFRSALYDAGAAEAAAVAAAGNKPPASDGGILRQLQRLFVSLQTSSSQAIDTKELTRSFGWDASGAHAIHARHAPHKVPGGPLPWHGKCAAPLRAAHRHLVHSVDKTPKDAPHGRWDMWMLRARNVASKGVCVRIGEGMLRRLALCAVRRAQTRSPSTMCRSCCEYSSTPLRRS